MDYRNLAACAISLLSVVLAAATLVHYLWGERPQSAVPARFSVPSELRGDKKSADKASATEVSIDGLRAAVADSQRLPTERVAAMAQLAARRDWKGVTVLIDHLDDPSLLIRGRSAAAIRAILGTDFQYRAGASRADRLRQQEEIRRYWSSRRTHPPIVLEPDSRQQGQRSPDSRVMGWTLGPQRNDS